MCSSALLGAAHAHLGSCLATRDAPSRRAGVVARRVGMRPAAGAEEAAAALGRRDSALALNGPGPGPEERIAARRRRIAARHDAKRR